MAHLLGASNTWRRRPGRHPCRRGMRATTQPRRGCRTRVPACRVLDAGAWFLLRALPMTRPRDRIPESRCDVQQKSTASKNADGPIRRVHRSRQCRQSQPDPAHVTYRCNILLHSSACPSGGIRDATGMYPSTCRSRLRAKRPRRRPRWRFASMSSLSLWFSVEPIVTGNTTADEIVVEPHLLMPSSKP